MKIMQYPILNQITQTHNEGYINQLFEELVSLNIKAMEEAKRRQSRQITWVSIKELQASTGWGRTKLEEWRDQGKFQFQQSGKGGKYLYNLEDVQRFCRSLQK